jgi:TolB-like protein/DNA-binding winged helix-turn-helix (wHTH) protein
VNPLPELPPASANDLIRFGAFEVDVRAGEVRKHGIRIKLQDQPFRVLQILLEHPGEVVTRAELQRQIWPSDTFVDFDRGLNNAVRRLREALGDSAETPRYIETLSKHGYRFFAAVEKRRKEVVNPLRVSNESPALKAEERTGSRIASRAGFVVALSLVVIASTLFALDVRGWRSKLALMLHPPVIRSLAVLPLQNLSGDPAEEYFSDGMTDAVITDLAQIVSIKVISRTSMMRYKKTDKSLPEIARELNVDAIVEGAVQRSGDHVRISAQLIYGPSDKHLWARSYERELRDTLRLQTEVAQDIADEVSASLTGSSRQHSVASYPLDVLAYDEYLKGRSYTWRLVKDDVVKGIEFLERSVQRDPNYAPAYVELSLAYHILAANNYAPPSEMLPKAKVAAMKALALDPNLGEAHSALGLVEGAFEWHWADQEMELRRGVQLDPGSSGAHMWYAFHLAAMGKDVDARQEMTKALNLDPFSPYHHSMASYIYFVSREYDTAIREARRALEIDPVFAPGHANLASVLGAKGEFEEGFREWLRFLELNGDEELAQELQRAAKKLSGPGDPGQKLGNIGLRYYLKKSNSEYVGTLTIASAYIDLGDKNKALEWLDRAAQEHSPSLLGFVVTPYCDLLRSETHFKELLQRMKLPVTVGEDRTP